MAVKRQLAPRNAWLYLPVPIPFCVWFIAVHFRNDQHRRRSALTTSPSVRVKRMAPFSLISIRTNRWICFLVARPICLLHGCANILVSRSSRAIGRASMLMAFHAVRQRRSKLPIGFIY
ncbi:MAG: hypothetical protein AVDCRST_MAG93-3062 [uncultured Chloroflexia bacterium]|uniref:Uncharacterized protein n=1 Tax=uncultured Chloroflexia bacterium TaxID=1672391 RepID=A0A6J4JHC5_9CHLR|nr:MAG: hypothetical protein AVDCRST_MAG93-3062 [uncultured Chloroflexia bacterium]